MNGVSERFENEERMNGDFPVTLVRNIGEDKGKEMTFKDLNPNISYRFRTQRPAGVRLSYGREDRNFKVQCGPNASFTHEKLCKMIQENPSIKYYLVPVKRGK